MDVERFDCTSGGVAYCMGCYRMTPAEDGAYVKSETYDQLVEDNAALRLEVERLRVERDALLAAARGVEGRIYEAAKGINDATRWPDEESFDGSAETIQSWITADLDAAIALAEQP